ncbi:hypothetical protein K466DRAFT_308938 [Polyporus arcularius HHB13444]|uniref:Uncharacterized protein n=1 Tax=Polyporus arcularius HHB13444 TaxID=1314778 RepID=A0A5C3NZJ9_9APHY|nr:hypothetical protein K466DRAFT_308938 [Polyporus arcularius HHB13444]
MRTNYAYRGPRREVGRRENLEMSTHARSSGYRHTPARESKPTGTWRRAIPSSVSLEGAGAGRGSGSGSDDTEQLEAALRTPRRHKIDALYVWHGPSLDSVLRLRGLQRTREPRLWPAPLPSTQPAPPFCRLQPTPASGLRASRGMRVAQCGGVTL